MEAAFVGMLLAVTGGLTTAEVMVVEATLKGEVTAVGDVVGSGAPVVDVVEGVEAGRGETMTVTAVVAVILVVEVYLIPKVVTEVTIV
jgi:hypothetical protein